MSGLTPGTESFYSLLSLLDLTKVSRIFQQVLMIRFN